MKHNHKKEKIRKDLFYIILRRLRQNKTKSKRSKVWIKALFQEKENKGSFHQTLQNIRVSDREANFSHMITKT